MPRGHEGDFIGRACLEMRGPIFKWFDDISAPRTAASGGCGPKRVCGRSPLTPCLPRRSMISALNMRESCHGMEAANHGTYDFRPFRSEAISSSFSTVCTGLLPVKRPPVPAGFSPRTPGGPPRRSGRRQTASQCPIRRRQTGCPAVPPDPGIPPPAAGSSGAAVPP